MRHHEFLSEDELFEIKMSPSNLAKLVKDIPGALVGLEFEMIVPDAGLDTDDDEYVNDYDADERCRNFNRIENFFLGGDGNNSRRDVERMIEKLREQYLDWASEQRYEDWENNGFDFFRDYAEDEFDEDDALEDATEEIKNENPEMDQDSEEFNKLVSERVEEKKETWLEEQWDDRGNLFDSARESWEDGTDWPDEEDFLDSQGYRYMSDVEGLANNNDIYWPWQTTQSSQSQSQSLSDVAENFSAAVGRKVEFSSSYHNINRGNQARQGFYILEPDGSLEPDDASHSGLEFVSPPLPIAEMIAEIKRVADWAEANGCYTGKNNKTGLHMNISVPNYSKENLDYVKLVLLLGDNHILEQFDRVSNTYAESSFNILANKLQHRPELAQTGLATMKQHFDLAASKSIHSGYTDKYTSINVKDNRVEFRSPGGDYLTMFKTNPNRLFAPLMRFAVALDAACNPEKYRKEYQKKLYKFFSNVVKGQRDLLELFARYASGELPKTELKTVLKLRGQERQLKKPGEGIRVGGRLSNPNGDWMLFRPHATGVRSQPYHVEVLYRFNAADTQDAHTVMDQYVQEFKPSFQVSTGHDPQKKYGQPGEYSPLKSISTPKDAAPTNQTYNVFDTQGGYNVSSISARDDAEAQAQFRQRWGTDPRFQLRRSNNEIVTDNTQ